MATSWARVRKAYVLRELDIPTNLWKYAGALAFVLAKPSQSVADICIVPRLYVKIEREGEKAQRKRLPRLLHPKTIGVRQKDWNMPHPMDPEVWWQWGLHHRLETVSEGVYRFKRPKGDSYRLPFAIFTIPVTALHVAGVVPRHNKLNLFHEGMAIGAVHLQFPAPSPEFIWWSYERYVAVPLEIGNNVEVDMKPGWVRGVIEDIQFENVVVRVKDLQVDNIEVHIQQVRRYYQPGDAVKVVRPQNAVKLVNLDRKGLVVVINQDGIEVLDCTHMEQVGRMLNVHEVHQLTMKQFHVNSWQLIPSNDRQRYPHRFEVGDRVQVINHQSDLFGKKLLISNVKGTTVEVTGDELNTRVC